MKKKKDIDADVKRPLLEIVMETKEYLTPEMLFKKAGYTFDEIHDIEAFYAELSKEYRESRIKITRLRHSGDIHIQGAS